MKKVLIANRGEIAVRIIRAAKEMNMATVAIYSDPDRASLHVRMADEAYRVGPASARDSYLNMDSILEACRLSGADGVHPGYGFLSENAVFARRVEDLGLVFIGPSADSIELMGDKLRAKELALSVGVPLVPGSVGGIGDEVQAIQLAQAIGFPVLIKAAAGGGGKGMRIVHHASEMESAFRAATGEAYAAFGDGSVFLEKYIVKPRHIEIQILADQFGDTVHLGERECSIQRRHQKVIEEAPSVLLTTELRAKMGKWAIELAKACGYKSTGTLEFILDEQLNIYFLEMNTRLQVEHPITELITGIDLVKEQLRIACGEPLGYNQADIWIRGHAIEVRLYAEDPENDFLPDTGQLEVYQLPSGPGIRVDNGVEQGQEVSVHYDPMLAKLISYGESREVAIQRMIRGLNEYEIEGIATTKKFGLFVMNHPAFKAGKLDTHFIQTYFRPRPAVEPKPLVEPGQVTILPIDEPGPVKIIPPGETGQVPITPHEKAEQAVANQLEVSAPLIITLRENEGHDLAVFFAARAFLSLSPPVKDERLNPASRGSKWKNRKQWTG